MCDQFQYDVFLSYNSKDNLKVRQLAKHLKANEIKVWFDEWVIKPGDDIPLKIKEGLESSKTMVLAMSRNAFGSDWVTMETNTVLFDDPTNKERRLIPILIENCDIPATIKRYRYIDWRTESRILELLSAIKSKTFENYVPSEHDGWTTYIKGLKDSIDKGAKEWDFKNLNYYEIYDKKMFKGRDSEIEETVKLIEDNKIVCLSGESGNGKSSFLNAGLIPELLEKNFLPIYVRVDSGMSVNDSLKYELSRKVFTRNKSLFKNCETLLQISDQISDHSSKNVVIILDQLEQIFLDDDKEKVFKNELQTWFNIQSTNLRFLLSIRDNYLHKIQRCKKISKYVKWIVLYPLTYENAYETVKHILKMKGCNNFNDDFIIELLNNITRTEKDGENTVNTTLLQTVFPFLLNKEIFTLNNVENKKMRIKELIQESIDERLNVVLSSQKHRKVLLSLINRNRNNEKDQLYASLTDKEIKDRVTEDIREELVSLLEELEDHYFIRIRKEYDVIKYELIHETLIEILEKRFPEDFEKQLINSRINYHIDEALRMCDKNKAPEVTKDILKKAFDYIDDLSFAEAKQIEKKGCLFASALKHDYKVEEFKNFLNNSEEIRRILEFFINDEKASIRLKALEILEEDPDIGCLEVIKEIVDTKKEKDKRNRIQISKVLASMKIRIKEDDLQNELSKLLVKMVINEETPSAKKEIVKILGEFPECINELITYANDNCHKNNKKSIETLAILGVENIYANKYISIETYKLRNLLFKANIKIWFLERRILLKEQYINFLSSMVFVIFCCSVMGVLGGTIAGQFEGSILWRGHQQDNYISAFYAAFGAGVGGIWFGTMYHFFSFVLKILIPKKKDIVLNIFLGSLLGGAIGGFVTYKGSLTGLAFPKFSGITEPSLMKVWLIYGTLWGLGLGVGYALAHYWKLDGRMKYCCQIIISFLASALAILLCFLFFKMFYLKELIGEAIIFWGGAIGVILGYIFSEKVKKFNINRFQTYQ